MNKAIKWLSAVLPLLGILTLAWCVWSESFAPVVLLQGGILGLVALLTTNRILLKRSYQERYRLSPLVLLRFFLVLTVEIFRSGIHAIHIMLTDRINIGVVDLPTSITDPLRGVLVASAITLTPGTVTIDFSPGTFKVVWIDCTDTDLETAAESIKGRFERALMPVQAKQASEGTL
jgi:multicomponent Na+:H+ antiporter subunit E